MFQVRFHGRGGQVVVTAAELLAEAAFREDRYAQAFPNCGSERMRAPVMSFCRIDDKPIRAHLFRPAERTEVIARIQAAADRNIARFGLMPENIFTERARV
jgi:pyruvate ferredoxin oxidoreductase gamma subunit